jgi:hypothetical protein
MGRVRRYKKVKACDLGGNRSKVRPTTTSSSSHNEPPSLFEDRARKAEQRRMKGAESEEDRKEIMLQREALRQIAQSKEMKKTKDHSLEGRKADESMKAFKTRIRNETKKTLHEELSGRSSTSQRRKEKVKLLRVKKKEKKREKGHADGSDNLEFFSAADGRVRPSDRGGPASFSRTSEDLSRPAGLSVGLVVPADRPPTLTTFKLRMPEKTKNVARTFSSDTIARVTDEKQGRRQLGLADGIIHPGDGSGRSSAAEMEVLRQRVQDAYRKVKDKRKQQSLGGSSGPSYIM